MSHAVTIRTATVTTSGNSSGIFVNTNYLKTYAGCLKLLQLALGIVCVGIIASHYNDRYHYVSGDQHIFFFLMATTFMISTFILLLSCLISLSTATIISKTIFEVVYHSLAFGLVLAASLMLLIKTTNEQRNKQSELLIGAASCGLINAILYFFSTILALRSYRGM